MIAILVITGLFEPARHPDHHWRRMEEHRMSTVTLEPWTDADFGLLRRLLGDPAMMEHLGGPEPEHKLAERQARYLRPDSGCFRVLADGEAVGWVGAWDREWRGEHVAEVGWSVLVEAQGRGIAAAATSQLLTYVRALGRWRWAHAFPSVGNGPSNALCRKLGFELLGDTEFEWPPDSGERMRCNDWRISLA
jgi:RimJ/RimL family protein N-acetyltransferase